MTPIKFLLFNFHATRIAQPGVGTMHDDTSSFAHLDKILYPVTAKVHARLLGLIALNKVLRIYNQDRFLRFLHRGRIR